MNEPDRSYGALLWQRFDRQGFDHPDTARTLANLLVGRTRGLDAADREAADLPDGVTPADIRLEHDRVDSEIDLIELAMARHDRSAEEFGGQDPRTLVARMYLAYALAVADHLDSQLEAAAALAQDAYEGLDDAEAAGIPLGPYDVRSAKFVLDEITERLAERG